MGEGSEANGQGAASSATGFDRRRFLRTAAATTAVVWVAPAVTGAPLTPAFAQASPVPNGGTDGTGGTNGGTNGGTGGTSSGTNGGTGGTATGTPEDPGSGVGGVRFETSDPDVEVAGVTLTSAGSELPRTGDSAARWLALGAAAVAGGAATLKVARSRDAGTDGVDEA